MPTGCRVNNPRHKSKETLSSFDLNFFFDWLVWIFCFRGGCLFFFFLWLVGWLVWVFCGVWSDLVWLLVFFQIDPPEESRCKVKKLLKQGEQDGSTQGAGKMLVIVMRLVTLFSPFILCHCR